MKKGFIITEAIVVTSALMLIPGMFIISDKKSNSAAQVEESTPINYGVTNVEMFKKHEIVPGNIVSAKDFYFIFTLPDGSCFVNPDGVTVSPAYIAEEAQEITVTFQDFTITVSLADIPALQQ